MVPQTDGCSCAAACMATIVRLYSLDPALDYAFFRHALGTTPEGVDHETIAAVARQYLPPAETRTDIYTGGIALGYMQHKTTGDDHVVVFLAQKDDAVIYYCPLDNKIYLDKWQDMRRAADVNDPTAEWTCCFENIQGADFSFWQKYAVSNPAPGISPEPHP